MKDSKVEGGSDWHSSRLSDCRSSRHFDLCPQLLLRLPLESPLQSQLRLPLWSPIAALVAKPVAAAVAAPITAPGAPLVIALVAFPSRCSGFCCSPGHFFGALVATPVTAPIAAPFAKLIVTERRTGRSSDCRTGHHSTYCHWSLLWSTLQFPLWSPLHLLLWLSAVPIPAAIVVAPMNSAPP